MMNLLSKRMQSFAQQEWLHKSVRTLLAVTPGLVVFVSTGDQRGVMFAFAALCLSVPYGDLSFNPAHLAGCALVSALLMPAVFWLQFYPKLYVPFLALAGMVYTQTRRSTILPPRVPTSVLIYILYQSSELHGRTWSAVLTADLLVAPAALWVYLTCFYLWPWRVEHSGGLATAAAEPEMSVPVNAICAALSVASAAAASFAFHLPHPNWVVWSSLTVNPAGAGNIAPSLWRATGGRRDRLHTGSWGSPSAGRQAATASGDYRRRGAVHGVVRAVHAGSYDSQRAGATCRLRPARRRDRCRSSALFLHSHRSGHWDYVYVDSEQPPGK